MRQGKSALISRIPLQRRTMRVVEQLWKKREVDQQSEQEADNDDNRNGGEGGESGKVNEEADEHRRLCSIVDKGPAALPGT